MPGVAHTHEWNPLEGAAARYLCACGAPGRRNLAGKILEDRTVATVARVDPEDLFTARPSPEEEARVPHRLYGRVDAAENYSVGRWCRDVGEALAETGAQGRMAILVGGTGLYFKALLSGLAAVPAIPAEIRAQVRARLANEGAAALHAELTQRDSVTAQRLMVNDRSRISRALEVVLATGRSLTDWHRDGMPALVEPEHAAKVVERQN